MRCLFYLSFLFIAVTSGCTLPNAITQKGVGVQNDYASINKLESVTSHPIYRVDTSLRNKKYHTIKLIWLKTDTEGWHIVTISNE